MADRPSSLFESSPNADPARLLREAVSLGLILTASLATVLIESRFLVSWSGYPSTLVLLGLAWLHKRRFHVVVGVRPVRRTGKIVVVVLACVLVANVLLEMLRQVVGVRVGVPIPTSQMIHLALLVPLAEEFYFRGLLLEHLRRGVGTVPAIFACSVLFAAMHVPAGGMVSAFWLSMAACVLVAWTGSLAPALQLHVAWNAICLLRQLEAKSAEGLYLGLIASALVMLLALPRRRKDVPAGEPA